jgi:hypothetical protein
MLPDSLLPMFSVAHRFKGLKVHVALKFRFVNRERNTYENRTI